MSVEIKTATRSDLNEVADILADGFHDDPVMRWAFNGPGGIPTFLKAMTAQTFAQHGISHIETGGLGATLWLSPGQSYRYGPRFSARMLWLYARHGGLTGAKRSSAMGGFMASLHPHEPHYYLFAIAARASAQGKGVGGALMRKMLARADEENMPCYLENSKERNLGFYRSHGFEVMKEVETPADCPPLWPMWRQPAGR